MEELRDKLNSLVNEKGINDKETIEVSQMMDLEIVKSMRGER